MVRLLVFALMGETKSKLTAITSITVTINAYNTYAYGFLKIGSKNKQCPNTDMYFEVLVNEELKTVKSIKSFY